MSQNPIPVPAVPTDGPDAWNGWGDPARRTGLPDHARRWLTRNVGEATPDVPVPFEQARVRPSALPADALAALHEAVGAAFVLTDDATRARRAGGKSYLDLVRRRAGDALDAPDAVVLPADAGEVSAVLTVCVAHDIAVVPLGGGTSVVGGVEPVRGRFTTLVSLDLRRLDALVAVDTESMLATFGPGVRGPDAEKLLAAQGLTLGHFPQSFEQATIGGFVATRSSGQASSGYGRIDANVVGLRLATPAGPLDLPALPPNAAGPDLRSLVVGSEGTLGVLTEVTLRVRRAPTAHRYEGWSFPDFATGLAAFRALQREGVVPTVTRLSDPAETKANLALSGGTKTRALVAYLAARGHRRGCLAIVGQEGTPAEVTRRRAASTAVLKAHGGLSLGPAPGRAWEHGRYHGPFLRDDLLDAGYLVETLETATTWTKLPALHAAVSAALTGALTHQGREPLVMSHLSHLYAEGASLYFTVITPARPGRQVAQWSAAKTAACEAIVGQGATISHHHAVGTDHAPYLGAEVGELGVAALRAVKSVLDPTGILNPGKLLPPEPAR